ncbi:hypothetical protein EBI_26506 [Enterocytozoon bieneusi H348]|nr:hypothetical protein EBI_26506 [Enterocytozoon bieneusi H348]|eukprot:XP_002651759.1 hypothetical protein EBI_26506 [Enterocytozoon bieneusi H348]
MQGKKKFQIPPPKIPGGRLRNNFLPKKKFGGRKRGLGVF